MILKETGLSAGDALGAAVFIPGDPESLHRRQLPPAPWTSTGDTVMALGITEVLQRHGRIDQEVRPRSPRPRPGRRGRGLPGRGCGPAERRVRGVASRFLAWRSLPRQVASTGDELRQLADASFFPRPRRLRPEQ
jgi:hypothetical protein